jgi:hypothetical protein
MSNSTSLNSNSSNFQQKFDYDSLHTETSLFVLQQTAEIRTLVKRAARDISNVGQKLIEVKAKLGHGNFLRWLEVEFQWSWDTAKRFMRVAEVFGENQQIADFYLAPSVLYILAAPSTPKAAREEALSLAKNGERVTYQVAKGLKQKHTTASDRKLNNNNTPKPESRTSTDKQNSDSNRAIASTADSVLSEEKEITIARKTGSSSSPQLIQKQIANSSWWQLGTKHLLYCGDPDAPEFVGSVGQAAQLLLTFPPAPTWRSPSATWQPNIPYKTLFATSEYLPKHKNITQLDAVLESNILFYTDLWNTIVVCFLPSPEILSTINRLDRRSIIVEPDLKRCRTAITDWTGLKVERR